MSMQGGREGIGTLSRRVFLRGAAGSAAVALLAACGGAPKPTEIPLPVNAAPPASLPADAALTSDATAAPAGGNTSAIESAGQGGALFAMTNANGPNAVIMYTRFANGNLSPVGSFRTGGTGIGETDDGAALDSQGSLALSQDGRLLFAVNAGSGDISTFTVTSQGLTLVDRIASRGPRPISVTVYGKVVYVLNYNRQAPGNGNITAFVIGTNNRLSPLPDSTRALSTNGAVNPGQVLFNPSGNLLAVSEKATNRILTYTLKSNGLANNPVSHAATGQTPFGLAFNSRGILVCANAVNDAEGSGSASAFAVSSSGTVNPIGGAVANRQTAPCWVAIDRSGEYAYFVNALSNSLSACRIDTGGRLTLLNGGNIAARTGEKPFDIAFSSDNRYVYVLNSGGGSINGYRVLPGGSLADLGVTRRVLPAGANGLAVL